MLDALVNIVFEILLAIVKLLPLSPFLAMTEKIAEFSFLGFLNYFIPFDSCLSLLQAWLVCVALYYVIRNLKQIVEFMKGMLS